MTKPSPWRRSRAVPRPIGWRRIELRLDGTQSNVAESCHQVRFIPQGPGCCASTSGKRRGLRLGGVVDVVAGKHIGIRD